MSFLLCRLRSTRQKSTTRARQVAHGATESTASRAESAAPGADARHLFSRACRAYEGQNACRIHSSSTPAESQLFAQKIVASDARRGYAANGQLTVFSTVLIF